MENLLRSALLDWLRTDPALASLNSVEEESPLSSSPPWLGIAASASTDWSTKDAPGREIRIAFELATRGDDPGADAALVSAIERRIESLPKDHAGFALITAQFMRARTDRRTNNRRAVLLEYRFRILAN